MPGIGQCFEHGWKLLDSDAEASHSRVDLQVHGMLCYSKCCSSLVERFDLPSLPHCWSEFEADDLVFLAAPEPGHEQDVGLNSRLVQRDRLIERRDAKPLCALRLERTRALDGAVSVSVGFHDGTNRHALSDMLLHCAEVLPKSGERDIRPRRARCRAAYDFCSCGHSRDYSGSSRGAEVTPGLLLSTQTVARWVYWFASTQLLAMLCGSDRYATALARF